MCALNVEFYFKPQELVSISQLQHPSPDVMKIGPKMVDYKTYVSFTVSDCDCDCENRCNKMGTEPIVSQQFFCSGSNLSKKIRRRNQKIVHCK